MVDQKTHSWGIVSTCNNGCRELQWFVLIFEYPAYNSFSVAATKLVNAVDVLF